ncbi:MAG: hypothetical protein Q8P57_01385 [Candidatus Pacearchaeota archaeon]|nr:hypothetical protein [Candidatus Pacearchaeota archaeon]
MADRKNSLDVQIDYNRMVDLEGHEGRERGRLTQNLRVALRQAGIETHAQLVKSYCESLGEHISDSRNGEWNPIYFLRYRRMAGNDSRELMFKYMVAMGIKLPR